MIDLTTTYLGLELKNPLVCSASPICESVDNIRRLEDCGVSAVVLHSLFEEQLTVQSTDLDRFLSIGENYAESITYFPDMTGYNLGPDGYLDHIRIAKKAVDIPIIASLNGNSKGGWTKFAREIQEAGADAIELNIYFIPTDPDVSSAEVENQYIELVREVKSVVTIPMAVKLGPFFTATANLALRMKEAGADALVLFNRFYQPDFDLEQLEVTPFLVLSQSYELLLRLHWVALLYKRVPIDLAVTGGVHTAHDVLKAMMAGANVAMMTSSLLKHGIEHVCTVLFGINEWMKQHEYASIGQMRGSMSYRSVPNPAAFERGNYLKVLRSYSLPERYR